MNKMLHAASAAALSIALAGPLAAAPAQPVSHRLAEGPEQARALLKDQPSRPAPAMNVLTASLDAEGRLSTHCAGAENPAFRAWSERLRRAGTQER
jgi:hypothetical protein